MCFWGREIGERSNNPFVASINGIDGVELSGAFKLVPSDQLKLNNLRLIDCSAQVLHHRVKASAIGLH
jgi:hypothetical protein